MNSIFKNKSILISCIIVSFILILSSSLFGWYGYEKWKHRRSTFGNIHEAREREVLVKELNYYSSVELKEFNIYIEKGFKYGFLTSSSTRPITDSKYPYQLTFNIEDTINNFNYDYVNHKDFDSINLNVLLDKPFLEKTLILKIEKLNNIQWDSIGYIKVWDEEIPLLKNSKKNN